MLAKAPVLGVLPLAPLYMLRPDHPAMTLLLGALVAIAPLAMDIYLPSMPAMTRSLAATPEQVQLTISVYMLGWGAAQLFAGPLSDRFGRKPALIGGLVVFMLASIACALSTQIGALVASRFVQAVAMATVVVVPRAIVRDLYEGDRAAHTLSTMMLVLSVAPVAGAGARRRAASAVRMAGELRARRRVWRRCVRCGRLRAARDAGDVGSGGAPAAAHGRQLDDGVALAPPRGVPADQHVRDLRPFRFPHRKRVRVRRGSGSGRARLRVLLRRRDARQFHRCLARAPHRDPHRPGAPDRPRHRCCCVVAGVSMAALAWFGITASARGHAADVRVHARLHVDGSAGDGRRADAVPADRGQHRLADVVHAVRRGGRIRVRGRRCLRRHAATDGDGDRGRRRWRRWLRIEALVATSPR